MESKRILMPPLHIKLGLVKQVVKALKCEGRALQKILEMFPHLSHAKLKRGILYVAVFTGYKIRTTLKTEDLEKTMSAKEKHALQVFGVSLRTFSAIRKVRSIHS